MYRLRIPSKFLGANRPLTTSLCCPSSDPLVPNSANKKAMTWSGCRCILHMKFRWIQNSYMIIHNREAKIINLKRDKKVHLRLAKIHEVHKHSFLCPFTKYLWRPHNCPSPVPCELWIVLTKNIEHPTKKLNISSVI